MLHETINFTEDGRVNLKTYIHDDYQTENGTFFIQERPAIIVLPGGAYGFLADHEGEPVALTFMKEGFNTFVLNYSVGEYSSYPNPLIEISKAVWEVRSRAQEWHINPNQIVVMGFSAGAGISAMLGTQWHTKGLNEILNIPYGGNKPNAVVMGYGAASNTDLQKNADYIPPILGKIARDLTPELDIINYVSKETVPTFIWHTRYDQFVPSIQPLQLAQKFYEYDIPYELHMFEEGRHGMSVCNNLSSYQDEDIHRYSSVQMWVRMCVNWLYHMFEL